MTRSDRPALRCEGDGSTIEHHTGCPVWAPPDATDPTGLIAAFWTDPPGVLLQLTRPARGTTAMAEWLIGPLFDALVRRFPEGRDLRVVLDMRQMTGRSAIARALLIRHARTIAARLNHVVVIPSLHMGPTYVKVLEAAAVLLAAAGVPLAIEHNLDRALAKHGLRVDQPLAAGAAPSTARDAPRRNDALL
jgi:hypothetical protein